MYLDPNYLPQRRDCKIYLLNSVDLKNLLINYFLQFRKQIWHMYIFQLLDGLDWHSFSHSIDP